MAVVLWALVAVPLATGLALLGLGRRADRVAGPVALAAATAATAASLATATVHTRVAMPLLAGIPVRLAVDGLSAVMVLVICAVTLAILVYSTGQFASARFFGLMLLFAGAMLVTVTAADLVALLAGWEVMGAASYALIGYWWTEPDRVRAANLAFLTTRTADLGLYLAAGAALAGGVTDLSLAGLPGTAGPWLHAATAGLVVAALGKSAQLPFSFWLSRAMAGPSPVSALLHSATMVVAGAYLLLRLGPLLRANGWAATTVAWVGVVTALLLAAVALAQSDLKQLLAASTCSQIGFMVVAAGSGGIAAGTLQLVAHAATKSMLFLAAGAWLVALGTQDLRGLAGAARRHPLVGIAFTVGALTLAGVPPLSIWVAKDEVLGAARDRSAALYAVGLAATVLSAAYAAKALAAVWRPSRTDQSSDGRVTGLMRAPLPALACAAAVLGVVALPPLGERFTRAVGDTGLGVSRPWQLAVSGVLALATTATVVLARPVVTGPRLFAAPMGGVAGIGKAWLGLAALATRGVAAPTAAMARALATFDDRVVDATVRLVARLATGAARLADLRVERLVDASVQAVSAGARRLGALARRPQTGQVHQYYAQAAVALAVLTLVLILLG
jgi:NADH-quinone oxidoreductase subunit L